MMLGHYVSNNEIRTCTKPHDHCRKRKFTDATGLYHLQMNNI